MANKPATNAAIKPADIFTTGIVAASDAGSEINSTNFFKAAPAINGNTMINEKRAALERSMPSKTPVAMVDPERLIPGKMAMA